jgi:hypothetical protein
MAADTAESPGLNQALRVGFTRFWG